MNKKIKVMNHKPDVSDEEIQRYMNFEDVMVKHALAKSAVKAALIKKALIITVAAVAVVSLVWYTSKHTPNPQLTAVTKADSTAVIKPDSSTSETQSVTLAPEVPRISKQTDSTSPNAEKATRITKPPSTRSTEKAAQPARPSPAETEQSPVQEMVVRAEPVAGYPAFYEYLYQNLRYPAPAIKDSIQGVTTVTFIINKKGAPEKIEVINSLGPLFDAEARRLIEEMPEWKPAVLHGKPIASRISLPVTFQIVKLKTH